jgi:hypothetical protein
MAKKKYKSNNQEIFGFSLNGYDLWSNIMALFDLYNNPSNWKILCCAYLLIIYSLHFTLLCFQNHISLFLDLESWHVFKVLLSIPLRSVNYINYLISLFFNSALWRYGLIMLRQRQLFPSVYCNHYIIL